ncbi:DUF4340 domain-containing protein, partial [bacterium]|nr:DUF4340 domain-containing protein [bacterium]
GDDKWVISEPVQGLADESKLRTFLNKIKGAEIKQFIDEDPEMLASYGLNEPATKVVFWTGKPGNEASWSSRALMFGDVSESENVYTKRDGEKNVFEISPNELNDMPISWNDLRKSKISNKRTWNVQRFTVASAGDVILEASKESSEWYLKQPQQGKADFSSVSDVLRGIVELQASEFVEGATQDYGLDHPDLVFNLYGDEGDETISLAKSEDSDDPTSQAMYYGARQNPLEIYAIRSGAIRLLMDKISQVKVTKPAVEPEPEPTENEQ